MRNENISANSAVETGPLTRRRFMGRCRNVGPRSPVPGPRGHRATCGDYQASQPR